MAQESKNFIAYRRNLGHIIDPNICFYIRPMGSGLFLGVNGVDEMKLWGRRVSNGPTVLGPLATLALVFGLSTLPANAQSSIAGTVTGQVTDASGAAVPGASIKITDQGTGAAAFATISNEAGRYDFPDHRVTPGKYDITFSQGRL